MSEKGGAFSNVFQNPFSNKKEENKIIEDPPIQNEEVKNDVEPEKEGINVEEEEEGDGALNHLIYYSFYPLTCMVPLGEDFITINEKVPDMMKTKSNDNLLQETIKTFHGLMQEKDDEIINLRRQLRDDDSAIIKMTSASIQTDLTLSACQEMEQRLSELSEGLPEKVEKIHQLQMEKARLQKSIQGTSFEDDKSRINKLEEELDEALKSLVESEEENKALANEIKDLKQSYVELKWQLEEVNDLKFEVELAKIQTEEDMIKIKEMIKDKDIIINKLKGHAKDGDELDGGAPSEKNNVVSESLKIKELEKLREDYVTQIGELEKHLKEAHDCVRELERKGKPEKVLELPELIDKVRENVLDTSASNKIVESLMELFPQYAERLGSSDIEAIDELTTISMANDTTDSELKKIVNVLGAINFNEKREIDKNDLITCYDINQNDERNKQRINNKKKDELQQEALGIGLSLKVRESLLRMEIGDLRKEYLKLETILNLLNKFYPLTHVAALNKMSNMSIIDKIFEMRSTIFEICMHSFWERIFHQAVNEHKKYEKFPIDSGDLKVFSDLIFPCFPSEKSFHPILSSFVNVREILLVGEATTAGTLSNNLQMIKIQGVNLYQDVACHLLPRFPKEVRYLSMGKSIEDVVMSENNLSSNISLAFLSLFQDCRSEFSVILFNMFLTLDFEDEIFSPAIKNSVSEFKVSKLSVSSVSNKTETSLVKVGIMKNIKDTILRKLTELQSVMKIIDENSKSESYKQRSEMDLLKALIDIKERLLKHVFNSSFHPVTEKLVLVKGTVFLSCVSKERISLDFSMKIMVEKYRQKQLNTFNDLTVEEMVICVTRLNKALQIMSPTFIQSGLESKKSKVTLAPIIIKNRTVLKSVIDQCFFGKKSKILLTQNIEETSKPDNDSFQTLKEKFKIRETDKAKLEDVLQRMYDIDCELYPGDFDQNMDKREFSSIPDNELLEEILKLRLSIASYVIAPYEWSQSNDKDSVDYKTQFKALKEIESIMMKVEPDIVDDNIIVSETKLLKVIIGKLRRNKKMDKEKLKNCYVALKKVDGGIYNTKFDATETQQQFDRTVDNKERVALVLGEAEHLLNLLKPEISSKQNSNKLYENYVQIEELLEDIETKMVANDDSVKNIWVHTVLGRTQGIVKLISQKETEEHIKPSSVKEMVMNNLDDIKQWALESSDWRRNCFNKLNNLIRKLNSRIKNRKIQMSCADDSEMSGNFQDEKTAFEKAFSQLEDRLTEITSPTKKESNGKHDGYDLDGKSDDELKSIILSLEKEISKETWTKSDESEAKAWLDSRNRQELLIDCSNLVHSSTMAKINNLLNDSSGQERRKDRSGKSNQISQFEDDINAKLAKYEELCDTVEKLKVPQKAMTRQTNSPNQQLPSNSSGRRRHDMESSYGQQLNSQDCYSPAFKPYSSEICLAPNDDEDIDEYFQQRLDELQKMVKGPSSLAVKGYESITRRAIHNGSDVVVDGFEIEDERTPRYYSMKLQDIQHERKEDEMGALMHHNERHRSDLLTENENLQQQLYVRRNMQENQTLKLTSLENTEELLRQRLAALETGSSLDAKNTLNNQEMQMMRQDKQRLTTTLANIQRRMDQLNSEMASLSSSNANFQHENHNLIIKNQYLERSMNKLEVIYEDLVEQLSVCKTQSDRNKYSGINDARESPVLNADEKHKLRLSDKDKIELVKKLDILDQQNKLLRKHCEKLNGEVSVVTRKLAEAQSKCDTYLKQNQQLTEVLDKMDVSRNKFDTSSMTISLRNKDEEIKNLKNKIIHLETKLVSANESPSVERLKQELTSNKDREIMKLAEQVGSLQDRVDETRAQLEVKEYENRKLQSLTKQLQNKVDDDSYFPPPGYRLVKDS